MLRERYDRHRREDTDRWGDRAAAGGRLTPRRPLLWLAVMVARAAWYAVHRTAFGFLGTLQGRFALGAAALYVSASSVWGDPWSAYLGAWTLWLTLAAGVYGAYSYGRRGRWEERVANAVYHNVPGHSRAEPEVLWFGRRNLGRWTGSWDFGFRVPSVVEESDLPDITEKLRGRLPAAHGASWMLSWDLRSSTGYAELVLDMPDSLTRDEMLARLKMQDCERSGGGK